jgi:hypothetical protein
MPDPRIVRIAELLYDLEMDDYGVIMVSWKQRNGRWEDIWEEVKKIAAAAEVAQDKEV